MKLDREAGTGQSLWKRGCDTILLPMEKDTQQTANALLSLTGKITPMPNSFHFATSERNKRVGYVQIRTH